MFSVRSFDFYLFYIFLFWMRVNILSILQNRNNEPDTNAQRLMVLDLIINMNFLELKKMVNFRDICFN